MKLLLVPKPVLSKELAVISYCFRYQRGGEFLADQDPVRLYDGIVNLSSLTVLEDIGLDGFTNGLPLFVPLNQFTLLAGVTHQCSQAPEKIVFLLNEDTPPTPEFVECVVKLKSLGFRFAVENIRRYSYMRPIINHCNYILVNFRHDNTKSLEEYPLLMKHFPRHIFIASDVNNQKLFDQIKDKGFKLFEGRFYNLPVTQGKKDISPVKVNRIQLMNVVRDTDFEIDEIVKIVQQDTALSLSLFKLVNSAHLGLSQKIKSIQQAVALLGQKEVTKWVSTATAGLLGEDRPDELTRLSLIRAKFAENLAKHFEMAILANALFLMGLFSVLDVVLEMTMADALDVVSVTDEVYDALVFDKGKFAPIMQFIRAYEAADWSEVNRLMAVHNLNVEDVFHAYIDTIRWYSGILQLEAEDDDE